MLLGSPISERKLSSKFPGKGESHKPSICSIWPSSPSTHPQGYYAITSKNAMCCAVDSCYDVSWCTSQWMTMSHSFSAQRMREKKSTRSQGSAGPLTSNLYLFLKWKLYELHQIGELARTAVDETLTNFWPRCWELCDKNLANLLNNLIQDFKKD